MNIYRYRLCFTSPAFLGNASQSAQWRTPPIKALLRQWWRVAVAQQARHDFEALRKCENALFGTAADGGDSHRSLIRIRLGHWNPGQLKDWPRLGTLAHPNVRTPVGSDLYLGFGPLMNSNGATTLKAQAAVQAGESASLSLAVDAGAVWRCGGMDIRQAIEAMEAALWLIDRYGALGGRSRNGWGSVSLLPDLDGTVGASAAPDQAQAIALPTRPWQDALKLDWPHALGNDENGALIWRTGAFGDWKLLMQELARIKIGLRTQAAFAFTTRKDAPAPEARHWLSYPVTHHNVRDWGGNARLPNSLRFKVRPAPGNSGKVVGVIFHMPCKPPPVFRPDMPAITRVWLNVHRFLDALPKESLNRIPV